MPATNTYSQNAIELLRAWALLVGVSGRIAQDPRMGLLARVLPDFDDGALASAGLCTDGSPLELCERISVKPQAPAFTLEVPDWEGHSKLDALCRALRETASEQDLNETRLRLERIDGRVKTYWIGVDFAQPCGVRIYCHLHLDTSAETLLLAGLRLSPVTQRIVSELLQRGALRVVAWSIPAFSAGPKVAFQHPLEQGPLEVLAGQCGLPYEPLRTYMHLLDPRRGGWRMTRCGLALACDAQGNPSGLTVYHYAAPYFRDDEQLRTFALRLAEKFGWNTNTYRASSRLLDRPGERVRSLIGFTVAANGTTSMRLYGHAGGFARMPGVFEPTAISTRSNSCSTYSPV